MWREDDSAATLGPRTVAAIPARLGSTRLPRKPLLDLGGAPVVWRVYEAVRQANMVDAVWVVTDSDEIEAAVRDRGGEVRRVDAPCRSGTERVARALLQDRSSTVEHVLNIQGDEPFVGADLLRPLLDALSAGAEIATLSAPLVEAERGVRHRVKVVTDRHRQALYFSREAIPGDLHLGYYGFRAETLRRLLDLPRSPLAEAEDLEQLDWLHAGLKIAVAHAPRATQSIDTAEDLTAARTLLRETRSP